MPPTPTELETPVAAGSTPDAKEPRRRLHFDQPTFRPGFLVKLVLVALANALGVFGLLAAWSVQQWLIALFLVIALVLVDWAYFSRRAIAAKYLIPGLILLFVYQLFAMGYTGYVAFTNYGDGHNSTKADAIVQVSAQNETRVEGSAAYPLTVVATDMELGFAVIDDGVVLVGSADVPLEPAAEASVEGDSVTAIPGWDVLSAADVAQQQQEIVSLRVPVSDDPADGSIRTQNGVTGYVFTPTLVYDAEADTFTDTTDGTVYSPNATGNFESPEGDVLTPGWRVAVGFSNFTAMVADPRMVEPFVAIFIWTFVFAGLSVLMTFGLGIFLAVTFNDTRMGGRRFYRSMLILPYAFPGFLSALVWAGMLNERFGFVNQVLLGGAQIPWLTDPTLAKVAVLMINLWLGFPYMFLISTGALQAIPGDILEAAKIDGANRRQSFAKITLPYVMVAVAPLLVASFAFNFNNFALIYMLTGGGPNYVGTPFVVGHTDILISMVYSVAFESGNKQYGVASALSLLIFVLVGVISWLGLRRTRRLEEI